MKSIIYRVYCPDPGFEDYGQFFRELAGLGHKKEFKTHFYGAKDPANGYVLLEFPGKDTPSDTQTIVDETHLYLASHREKVVNMIGPISDKLGVKFMIEQFWYAGCVSVTPDSMVTAESSTPTPVTTKTSKADEEPDEWAEVKRIRNFACHNK